MCIIFNCRSLAKYQRAWKKDVKKKKRKKDLSDRPGKTKPAAVQPPSVSLLARIISLLRLPLADEGQPNYIKQNAFGISFLNYFDDKFLLRIVVNSSESRCSFLCLLGTDHHNFFSGTKPWWSKTTTLRTLTDIPREEHISLSLCGAQQKDKKISWTLILQHTYMLK